MRPLYKILLFTTVLSGIVFASYADRGLNRRAKKKIAVNIPANVIPQSKTLTSGTANAAYKGSVINNCDDECIPQPANHYLMTYQKGNSVFIVPVRQKVHLSDGEHNSSVPKLVVKPI